MEGKNYFKESKELILSTCSKSDSLNANVVISLGSVGDELLIANCQMKTTIKNPKENPRIVVIEGYCRLKGNLEIFDSEGFFEKGDRILHSQDESLVMKNPIVANIKKALDLDKQKVLFLK